MGLDTKHWLISPVRYICFADVIDISKACLAVTSSKTTAENLTAHFCAIFKGHQRKKQADIFCCLTSVTDNGEAQTVSSILVFFKNI
jgi:hypothetical protein